MSSGGFRRRLVDSSGPVDSGGASGFWRAGVFRVSSGGFRRRLVDSSGPVDSGGTDSEATEDVMC